MGEERESRMLQRKRAKTKKKNVSLSVRVKRWKASDMKKGVSSKKQLRHEEKKGVVRGKYRTRTKIIGKDHSCVLEMKE